MTPAITIPHFYASILFQARQNPGATAIEFGGSRVGYAAFCHHIDNVTGTLQRRGLAAGARILVDVPHPYLHWLIVIAASRLGLVSASVDAGADRRAMLATLGTNLIVAASADDQPDGSVVVVADQSWLDAAEGVGPLDIPAWVAPDAHARIIFSSGTTGMPKKIPLSFRNCDERLKLQAFDLGMHSRFMTTVGLSTIGGFMYPLRTWSLGGTVVFRTGDDVLHEAIARARLTHLFVSPAQLAGLMKALPRGFLPLHDLIVICGGGAIAPELALRTRLRLTPLLHHIYASTEAGTIAYCHAAQTEGNASMVGHVVPSVDLQIVDEAGQPVAPGTPGELRVRSPWCVDGYADEETSEAFRDGWFHPGDIAVLDASGMLSIVGRTSEMMNLGGHKIAPARIEEALASHPGVNDIAAFSIADAQGIERPWLAVVAGSGFSQESLVARMRELFSTLPPPNVAGMAAIPRNTMGKVMRKELRERVIAALTRPK